MSILGDFAGVGGGSIGRASVDLVLNSTAYNSQLAEAEAKTKTATGGLSKAYEDVSNALGPVGKAAVAAGALAAAAIGKAIGVTQDWAAEVRSLQRVTGQSAESASALAAAGNVLGLDVAKLTTGFGLLAKNIVNGSANLVKYGVATKDAQGNVLPFEQVLANVSDKFATLQAGPEQAAFAMNVFGRSGKDLIPILQRGSAGLQELYDKAAAAGVIMSQQDLDASKALTIAQRELGEAFKGTAIAIGKAFIPLITPLVNGLTKVVEFMTRLEAAVIKAFQAIGKALGPAFASVEKSLGDLKGAFADLGDALAPVLPILKEFGAALVITVIEALIISLKALAFIIETVSQVVESISVALTSTFTNAINLAIAAINVFIAGYNKVVTASNAVLHTHFEQIDALQQIVPAAEGAGAAIGQVTSATEDEAQANLDAAHAIESHTKAMRDHRLAQLQAAGGLLGLVEAYKSAKQASNEYDAAVRKNGHGSKEAADAAAAAAQATLDFRTQIRQFKADHPEASFASLKEKVREFANQAGVSASDFRAAFKRAFDDVDQHISALNSRQVTLHVDTSALSSAQAQADRLQHTLQRFA